MKRIFHKIFNIIFIILFHKEISFATIYNIPENNSNIVGENFEFTIPNNNQLPLEYFSEKFQVGLTNMLQANPNVDVYLPSSGLKVLIPKKSILPDTIRKGIVINIAEMRLYFYPENTKSVVILPIGIGQVGKNTPSNWVTHVRYKKERPTWTPTDSIRKEYEIKGEKLPKVFPSGLKNPMGLYALYIGNMYAIHGTNVNFGIGLRVSHGCIRLRKEDIKYLFDHVPVGTRVQFINEPVKATVEPNGLFYIEVHNPLSVTEEQFNSIEPIPIELNEKITNLMKKSSIDKNLLEKAIKSRSGIPVNVTLKK